MTDLLTLALARAVVGVVIADALLRRRVGR
jgi:hypothetical protein